MTLNINFNVGNNMSLASTFLLENLDRWCYEYADAYVSTLKKLDSRISEVLIKKLFLINDVPRFSNLEEFICYWVDHGGPVAWMDLCWNRSISEKNFFKVD